MGSEDNICHLKHRSIYNKLYINTFSISDGETHHSQQVISFSEIESPPGYRSSWIELALPAYLELRFQTQTEATSSSWNPYLKFLFSCQDTKHIVSGSFILCVTKTQRGKEAVVFRLPLVWPFASSWKRGLHTGVMVQNEERDAFLLCFFCSSGAPAQTLCCVPVYVDWLQCTAIRDLALFQHLMVPVDLLTLLSTNMQFGIVIFPHIIQFDVKLWCSNQ